MIESEQYESADGIIILVAPEGVDSVRYLRSLASKVLYNDKLPQHRKRQSGDNLKNRYTLGALTF